MAARRAGELRARRLRSSRGGLVLAVYAAVLLAASATLPWWRMESRAPQYGMRVLWVDVHPGRVEGDVREIDGLGHYVGIRPLAALARVERMLAPVGMLGALAGLLVAPWLRGRALRLLAILPALFMPVFLLVDLNLWMHKAVNDRDPNASLSLTVSAIDPKILGEYDVDQFKVAAELGGGLYLAAPGALLGLGLVFARPRLTSSAVAMPPERSTGRSPEMARSSRSKLCPG